MGRQMRRNIVRVFTIGIIVCCCLTFIPKVNIFSMSVHNPFSLNGNERWDVRLREKSNKYNNYDEKPVSFKEISIAMEEYMSERNHHSSSNYDHDIDKLSSHKRLSDFDKQQKIIDPQPEICAPRPKEKDYLNLKATIIISLANLGSDDDPVFLVSRILSRIPDHVTNDVIITVKESIQSETRQRLEEAVDLCATSCRLFLFPGSNIYQHRNAATKFSREQNLIFIDGRVIPANGWIEPLLFELHFNPWSAVSPQLHLRRVEDNGQTESNVGLSRLDLSWDLHVVRGALSHNQKQSILENRITAFNQTSILKEVLGVKKDFFSQIGNFDLIPGAYGGEHVSFSLKVMNCGGVILSSFCSRVYLDLPSRAHSVFPASLDVINGPDEAYFIRDYHSPSFITSKSNVSAYYNANSKIWLDGFSSAIYLSSVHRQVTTTPPRSRGSGPDSFSSRRSHFSLYGKYANSLKSHLLSMECDVANFRYVISKFQPDGVVSAPKKTSRYFGYIRSLDGMYSLALPEASPFWKFLGGAGLHSLFSGKDRKVANVNNDNKGNKNRRDDPQNKNNDDSEMETRNNGEKENGGSDSYYDDGLTLTMSRNASIWIGPFSLNEGKLVYHRILCLGLEDKRLVLSKCQANAPQQLFIFVNNYLKPVSSGAKLCLSILNQQLNRNEVKHSGGGGDGVVSGSKPRSGNSGMRVGVSKDLSFIKCDNKQQNSKNTRFVFDMDIP